LLAIALRPAPDGHGRLEWIGYLRRAWKRGRRATWLPVAPLEQLHARPLDEARRLLGIEPPEVAHPRGIIVFSGAHST
jgi:hypothetical protein